jgi:hypothetical protein
VPRLRRALLAPLRPLVKAAEWPLNDQVDKALPDRGVALRSPCVTESLLPLKKDFRLDQVFYGHASLHWGITRFSVELTEGSVTSFDDADSWIEAGIGGVGTAGGCELSASKGGKARKLPQLRGNAAQARSPSFFANPSSNSQP